MAIVIFTDSSSELSKELREQYKIDYFRMGIVVKGEEKFADINWEDYSPEQLYEWVSDLNNHCKTSLVTYKEFSEKMIPYLEKGDDIFYIACTTYLSGTLGAFEICANELREKYPNRKIIGIDSCRAEMALGLMCIECAKLRDQGKSIEELQKWIEDNRQFYHEVGSLETLTYLKAAGRVSGASAFFANMLGIKPVIMFDIHGQNHVFKKVKGSKKALEASFDYIKENMIEGVTDVVYVGQAVAKERQAYLKKRIEEELHIKTEKYFISPIVGICCGPGMYGCWFRGKTVTIDGKKK